MTWCVRSCDATRRPPLGTHRRISSRRVIQSGRDTKRRAPSCSAAWTSESGLRRTPATAASRRVIVTSKRVVGTHPAPRSTLGLASRSRHVAAATRSPAGAAWPVGNDWPTLHVWRFRVSSVYLPPSPSILHPSVYLLLVVVWLLLQELASCNLSGVLCHLLSSV